MLNNITTDEMSFIGECNKLGLSSEQIYNLWYLKLKQEESKQKQEESKQKQEELKLQIELCKFNSSMNDEENNNKKRKREETILQIDVSDSKMSKIVNNRHTEFCDDIIGKILEYLHFDLEVLRYIGVSKQFQRNILEKTKEITIEKERTVFPPYILPNVETLNIFCDVKHNAQLEFIYKCVNIKHLSIEALDCGDDKFVYFKFPKPSIETIHINVSNNRVILDDRNLFNLKKFEFWQPCYGQQSQDIINYYAYSLNILSVGDTKLDITLMLKLPLLQSLEIDKLVENQLLIILNYLKKLEILIVNIDEMIPVTSFEPDTKSVLNLKYLSITTYTKSESPFNDKVWKYDFSNLKALTMTNLNLGDWKSFSNNNTFTNLEVLHYNTSRSEEITTNIGRCENLKNLKHLGIQVYEIPRLDYGVFQKSKFKHLKTLSIKGCSSSLICNLSQIEGLKDLQSLHLFIDNEKDLIDFSKSNAYSNLKHLGISYGNEYPEEFFKNLSVNFGKVLKLDCEFKYYQDIELLRKYHPTDLQHVTIDNKLPSLGLKVLSKWKEIMWKYKYMHVSIMDAKLSKINTSLECEILRKE